MEKRIRFLAIALGVQLLLAVGLALWQPQLATPSETLWLTNWDQNQIDQITIAESPQQQIVLNKKDGAWQLAADGFPADGQRIEQLLRDLAQLKITTPVTTSTQAHARFKVASDAFERRVTLQAGNQPMVTVYFGTSPALRRSHARRDGEDGVYVVAFSTFDLPTQSADWQNKTLLHVPQSDITALDFDGLQVRRTPTPPASDASSSTPPTAPTWTASPLATDQQLNGAAVDKLVRLIAELNFSEVLGKEEKPEFGLAQPVLQFRITRKDGTTIDYRLGKTQDKDEYTLHVSTRPEYFRIASWSAQGLIEAAKRDTLVTQAAAAPETNQSSTPESNPTPNQ